MKKTLFTILFAAFSLVLKAQDAPENLDSLDKRLNKQVQESALPVEVGPEYPGGIKELFKFIEKHKRSRDARGFVEVSFIIEKDGTTSDFKVKRSLTEETDQEAIRVVRKMPRWIPATQNGNPVRVSYTIPIRF